MYENHAAFQSSPDDFQVALMPEWYAENHGLDVPDAQVEPDLLPMYDDTDDTTEVIFPVDHFQDTQLPVLVEIEDGYEEHATTAIGDTPIGDDQEFTAGYGTAAALESAFPDHGASSGGRHPIFAPLLLNPRYFHAHCAQRMFQYPIPRACAPKLAPNWTTKWPDAVIFADDLIVEGMALFSDGELIEARAKFEATFQVLDRLRPRRRARLAERAVALLSEGLELFVEGEIDEARTFFVKAFPVILRLRMAATSETE